MKAQAWVGQEERDGPHLALVHQLDQGVTDEDDFGFLIFAVCYEPMVLWGRKGGESMACTLRRPPHPASLGSTTPTALSFPISQGELREPAALLSPPSPPPAPQAGSRRAISRAANTWSSLTPDQADSQRPSYLPLWTVNSANLLSADPVKRISLVFVVHILSCS